MRNIIKNKHAWLRIVEAFIGIMIVLSVALILISRQTNQTNTEEELTRLLRATVDYISHDEAMRTQILANDTSKVNEKIGQILPSWINFSSNICDSGSACPNPAGIIKKAVYSDEVLIVTNLTYTPENASKLRVFMWEK